MNRPSRLSAVAEVETRLPTLATVRGDGAARSASTASGAAAGRHNGLPKNVARRSRQVQSAWLAVEQTKADRQRIEAARDLVDAETRQMEASTRRYTAPLPTTVFVLGLAAALTTIFCLVLVAAGRVSGWEAAALLSSGGVSGAVSIALDARRHRPGGR